ncbi:MAG: right-handed parallel beta-helix repeat-containing protein [Planctomycetes bacterium]|nr:right-handed parallel beta-helix repeat-containing protein [Planctomycetota bacterium]
MRERPIAVSRRSFLGSGVAIAAGGVAAREARGADPPPIPPPRALSGDPAGPAWEERLAITVGPRGADIAGENERAIQAAVDAMARRGGGTVRILPGTYRLRNAVYLRTGVRIEGSGEETILIKEPSATSPLAADADWYDQEIVLADPRGFELGDGICLRARGPEGNREVGKYTLVARSGNRFLLDRPLRKNFWRSGEARAWTLFPILSGEEVCDIAIEDLVLDGNRDANDELDGNYAGCIFLQDANRISIRRIVARRYHGDGVSWQVSHDVSVEDSRSHDHTGLGLHPGSGSQRSIIRGNALARNGIGLFFCWGVRGALAEKNAIEGNRCGISIGHRDTDNLVRDNTIRGSRDAGILFRDEPPAFAPHRNRFEGNRLIDNGPEDGAAIDIRSPVEDVVIARNEIRDGRGPGARRGIRIGKAVRDVRLEENAVEGFAVAIEDLREGRESP